MAGDYFTAGDRIPFDSCPDPFYTDAPYTELPVLTERMLDLSKDVRDRLDKICVPRNIWIQVVLMVCDAFDDGFKQGESSGVQKVCDSPDDYLRSVWE
ncbi:hypothetical protein DSECCO2_550890 [anaerobic digester metagenome]|jgi:hypothetical protein